MLSSGRVRTSRVLSASSESEAGVPLIRELDPSAGPLDFFGAELRRWRTTAGLSQEQLGQRVPGAVPGVRHRAGYGCYLQVAPVGPGAGHGGRWRG